MNRCILSKRFNIVIAFNIRWIFNCICEINEYNSHFKKIGKWNIFDYLTSIINTFFISFYFILKSLTIFFVAHVIADFSISVPPNWDIGKHSNNQR